MKNKIILFLIFSFLIKSALIAEIRYVNHAATGQNSGKTWANAFKKLDVALAVAKPGDAVWVAKGVYNASFDNFLYPFILPNGVKVYGGFKGTESDLAQRDWDLNQTILVSFTLITGPDTLPAPSVVYCYRTDTATLLDGFIVKGGRADNGSGCPLPSLYGCIGGGLFVYNDTIGAPTNLTVQHCTFLDNQARYGGGVGLNFYNGEGRIKIRYCQFVKNGTNDAGGALHMTVGTSGQSSIQIDNCFFTENFGYNSAGIIVFNFSDSLNFLLSNSIFTKNTSILSDASIGIENYGHQKLRIDHCQFLKNRSGSNQFQPGNGGAVRGFGFAITNSLLEENLSFRGGAGVIEDVEMSNCVFYGNISVTNGGALVTTVKNNLVSNTLINNQAGKFGGAISTVNQTKDTLLNSIFWGNEAGEASDHIYSNGNARLYVDHCVVDALDCESFLFSGLPQHDPLSCGPFLYFQLNPHFRDTALGDYRLASCSPLLDLGDPSPVLSLGIDADLDGKPRILDKAPDLGAYETKKDTLRAIAQVRDATGPQASDGAILVAGVTGGVEPYLFTWNDGSTKDSLTALPPGSYALTVTDQQGCTGTQNILVKYISDTQNPLQKAVLVIYPNPAQHQAYIAASGHKIQSLCLMDALGQTIKIYDLNGQTTNMATWQIPLETLPAGTYLARLLDENRQIVATGRLVHVIK